MFWYFPVWDISCIVALIFVFGSFIWMVNAFLILLPLTIEDAMSRREAMFTTGVTPFVATSTFVLGSVLLLLEAYNENPCRLLWLGFGGSPMMRTFRVMGSKVAQ